MKTSVRVVLAALAVLTTAALSGCPGRHHLHHVRGPVSSPLALR